MPWRSSIGRGERRYTRRAYSDIITFRTDTLGSGKMMRGVSVNISESGMCMFAFDPLAEGETIEIKNTLPTPHTKATVMWVNAKYPTMCKVGLMFIN